MAIVTPDCVVRLPNEIALGTADPRRLSARVDAYIRLLSEGRR